MHPLPKQFDAKNRRNFNASNCVKHHKEFIEETLAFQGFGPTSWEVLSSLQLSRVFIVFAKEDGGMEDLEQEGNNTPKS